MDLNTLRKTKSLLDDSRTFFAAHCEQWRTDPKYGNGQPEIEPAQQKHIDDLNESIKEIDLEIICKAEIGLDESHKQQVILSLLYYRAIVLGLTPRVIPKRVRLPSPVHSDSVPQVWLRPGTYPVSCNKWGACSISNSDSQLGIKPGEFFILEWDLNPDFLNNL